MKFLIAAGGTGGHINPGIAIGKMLKERGDEVKFIGTEIGMEKDLVPFEFCYSIFQLRIGKRGCDVFVVEVVYPALFAICANAVDEFGALGYACCGAYTRHYFIDFTREVLFETLIAVFLQHTDVVSINSFTRLYFVKIDVKSHFRMHFTTSASFYWLVNNVVVFGFY